jgi:hypothetical protein
VFVFFAFVLAAVFDVDPFLDVRALGLGWAMPSILAIVAFVVLVVTLDNRRRP